MFLRILFRTMAYAMAMMVAAFTELSAQDSLLVLGLPVVEVTTADSSEVASKTEWQHDARIRITLPDGTTDIDTTMSIRGRGNSTWRFPKKPYYIKLDHKAQVLGMPSDRRWVLLADWMDRTLMRNAVSLEISHRVCDSWAPHGRHVNLVLNGRHRGVYFLCEKIRISQDRLDIRRPESADTAATDDDKGFLLELDTYFDVTNQFRSSVMNLPYMVKQPKADKLTEAQMTYITDYVNDMETEVCSGGDYGAWLDASTFADWWIAYELTGNREPIHPKSTYMYKDCNGLLCAGPVWDFDSGTFMPAYAHKNYIHNFLYYPWLFRHYDFLMLVSERWELAKSRLGDIHEYIDSLADALRPSEAVNSAMWPITTHVNGDEQDTYDEAIERMHAFLDIKIPAIDLFLMQQVAGIKPQMVKGKLSNGDYFDLSGRRLVVPPVRGVYIENGKVRVKN